MRAEAYSPIVQLCNDFIILWLSRNGRLLRCTNQQIWLKLRALRTALK
jgi:hypothetical protein